MRQWTIDAFTHTRFFGNPACVLEPLSEWPSPEWMQSLAAENNQAETAFLQKTSEPHRFGLRWFTPTTEVPLCGHATLAAAHVLYQELGLSSDPILFETKSGPIRVRRRENGYEMAFPGKPSREVAVPEGFSEALGKPPLKVFAGDYLVALYGHADEVRSLTPNLEALKTAGADLGCDPGNIGVIAPSDDPRYDWIDRFFGPGVGIAEDGATGSLHGHLALLFKDLFNTPHLRFYQAYPGRGGEIETEIIDGGVVLRGQAVTVLESRLRLS